MDVLPKDRLVALHNLSAGKLDAALRLGGLPVPSLGVTKAVTPYTNFGEISLIGTRFLVDPRHVPVYACDAFTPSMPRVRGGGIFPMENAAMAVRRMLSPAAQRRRGLYGTGRLLADAAGSFSTMETMQAARLQVVEASFARAERKLVDDLLNRFVRGIAFCHQPRCPASTARRETSVMKALLTAYRNGATRAALLHALARRRFFLVPPELADLGVDILRRLSRVPTPYFEAKPPRLVHLREFAGAAAPRNIARGLREALKRAGLTLHFFDPEGGKTAQAEAVRALAFHLAEEACDFLYPVTTARIMFKTLTKQRPNHSPRLRHSQLPRLKSSDASRGALPPQSRQQSPSTNPIPTPSPDTPKPAVRSSTQALLPDAPAASLPLLEPCDRERPWMKPPYPARAAGGYIRKSVSPWPVTASWWPRSVTVRCACRGWCAACPLGRRGPSRARPSSACSCSSCNCAFWMNSKTTRTTGNTAPNGPCRAV